MDIQWERQLHQRGDAFSMAVTDGHIVIHERGTRLVSVDPADGSTRWDVPLGTWPRAVIIADDSCLAIPQNKSRVFCLDLATGRPRWRADLPEYSGHLVANADTVLVGGWRGYTPLRAFDVKTGQPRWETAHRVHTVLPVPAGDGFLVGEPGGRTVRLIDRHDGRELSAWQLPQPLKQRSDYRPSIAVVGPGRFLLWCGERVLVEIDLAAGVREFFRAETDLAASAPEYVGGLLWLPEVRAGYTVVDPVSGRILSRFAVHHELVGHVMRTEEGFLVASTSGLLFRLDSAGRLVERVSTARKISALRSTALDQTLVVAKGTLLAIGV